MTNDKQSTDEQPQFGETRSLQQLKTPIGTLHITKMEPRLSSGGMWAEGIIAGHRFCALTFSMPARHAEWEINRNSGISKLWLQRIDDQVVVYNWDRGLDMPPKTELAASIARLLADHLADFIWF